MTKDQREAYAIIEKIRKSIRKEASDGTYRKFRYTQQQFLAICALLHAGDYLRLGKPLTSGIFTAKFFEEN